MNSKKVIKKIKEPNIRKIYSEKCGDCYYNEEGECFKNPDKCYYNLPHIILEDDEELNKA